MDWNFPIRTTLRRLGLFHRVTGSYWVDVVDPSKTTGEIDLWTNVIKINRIIKPFHIEFCKSFWYTSIGILDGKVIEFPKEYFDLKWASPKNLHQVEWTQKDIENIDIKLNPYSEIQIKLNEVEYRRGLINIKQTLIKPNWSEVIDPESIKGTPPNLESNQIIVDKNTTLYSYKYNKSFKYQQNWYVNNELRDTQTNVHEYKEPKEGYEDINLFEVGFGIKDWYGREGITKELILLEILR